MAKNESPVKIQEKPQKRKIVKSPVTETDGPPPPKLADIDVYAQVVSHEQAVAQERDPNTDAELYMETCREIKTLLLEIADLKINPTGKTTGLVKEKQLTVNLKIIFLKKLNRLEKMRMKECREALQKYREQVDNDNLHLQNLLYENVHLAREVTKCYDLKSIDEDMELVPVEEFYANAPKNLSKEEITRNNVHELKLARLSWELTQRKELAAKLKQVELAKEALTRDIDVKKEQLNNLTPHLKTILDATKPLQSLLDIPVDKTKKMHELAVSLPRPLYILYVQADAFSRLAKWLSVSIVGKPEEVSVQEHHYDNVSSADSDSENESDTVRRRKQTQERRKSIVKDAIEARKEECLKRHGLSVRITLAAYGTSSASLSLVFQWLPVLEVVCVLASVTGTETTGIAAADLLLSTSLLASMFPGDTGDTCPNPAAIYHLQRAELDQFPTDVPGMGVPYLWAQTLCGLDPMQPEPLASVSVCRTSLETTLRAIRNRLRNRIALAQEVKLLESGEALKAHKLQATLTSFTEATLADLQAVDSGSQLLFGTIVDGSYLIYRAGLDVGGIKLTAYIALPPTYPNALPICVLNTSKGTSPNNDHVRDVEREVNVWAAEETCVGGVLCQLVHKLALCLEVLAATQLNPERPVKATCFRKVMGRKRGHPYRYMATAGGIYTHR